MTQQISFKERLWNERHLTHFSLVFINKVGNMIHHITDNTEVKQITDTVQYTATQHLKQNDAIQNRGLWEEESKQRLIMEGMWGVVGVD
jgi:hypothetical protein